LEQQAIHAEKYQALCGLIAGIAHHFNNDLAAMSGVLYLLKREMEKAQLTHAPIEVIEKKIFHIADMIKNLLTFSEYAFEVVSMESCNIAELLQKTVKRFEASLDEPLEISVCISDDVALVACDAEKISSALLLLLDNAKHAVAELTKASIVIQLRVISMPEDKQVVEIKIMDQGCGMTSEALSHAKEPFFTTREVGDGQGLGLSVATGIVHQHQGNLHLKSSLGEGTTAFIHLPVHDAVAAGNAEA